MDHQLRQAMSVVQTFTQGSTDVEDTLRELAELTSEALEADMAGLTVRDERHRPTTLVYTDRMVPELDQTQYDHDSGPCLDASRTHTVLQMDDSKSETRWPELAAAAAQHGIRSVLSLPVVVGGSELGAATSPRRSSTASSGRRRDRTVQQGGRDRAELSTPGTAMDLATDRPRRAHRLAAARRRLLLRLRGQLPGMNDRRSVRVLVLLFALAGLAGACGDDDDLPERPDDPEGSEVVPGEEGPVD